MSSSNTRGGILVDDFSNLTRTNGAATFTDSEAETYIESHSVDKFYSDLYVITRHYHLSTFGQVDFTGAVHSTEIELGTILVAEGSVTTTFFLLEDVDRSLEGLVRLDNTRVSDYHTTTYFVLVDTTEEETYVVTSFTLIKELAEHFNASYNRLLVFTETENLNFVTYLDNTSLNTASSNSTTASDREDVFNRHQEGLIAIALGLLNPSVNCVHKLHYAVNPLLFSTECTECRTADDRSILFEFVLSEEFTHFHFNEFEHFLIVNHVALVEEHYETGNVHLTSKQDVLTSLRHRTIGSSYYDDSTVHLSSTSNHVLHVVSVTRAVNVSIVTLSSFVLNVRRVDGDTTFLLFGSIVNLIERLHIFATETLIVQHLRDSSSKGSLTVVNVTDSTDVYVRFGTHESFFSHSFVNILIVNKCDKSQKPSCGLYPLIPWTNC